MMNNTTTRSRRAPIIVAAIVVLVVAIIAIAIVVNDDDNVSTSATTTAPDPTASTSAAATPTSTPTTTAPPTTAGSPTTTLAPTDGAVWPVASPQRQFSDPSDAARAFATEFVGFAAPVVGAFQAGDSRSGEVEVRPRSTGPVTTVLLRQLGPDANWSVTGTATAGIEIDDPTGLATISSPVRLSGRAQAFEGTVDVEVRADGEATPLATGFVTGRGDMLGPFDARLRYAPTNATGGSVVFFTRSAENGEVWEAAVIRVRFDTA